MLQLIISGEPVDLSPGTSISIEEESPVFDKDTIPGGFSFPFVLPITPKNRRILGFPERVEKAGPMTTELPFQLFHSGKLRASGTVEITEASETYKASLYVRSGDFASKINGKKLKDLDLGGSRTWEWKPEYKAPEDDFTLAPIYNSLFYSETYQAELFHTYFYRVNAFESGGFYQMPGNTPYVISPFPFIHYLINQVFKFAGFNVIENVLLSDPDFRDLVMYTIKDITTFDTTLIYQLLFYVDQFGNNQEYPTTAGFTGDRTVAEFNLVDSMPDMTITDFILSLRNFLNVAFIIEGDSVRIIKRQDLVLSASVIDITTMATGTPLVSQSRVNGLKLEWTPDQTDALWGEDFFKNIDDFIDFIKPPLATISMLETVVATSDEIRYITDVDLYFRYVHFAYDPDDDTLLRWQWVPWSLNFQNYRQGNAEEVFSTKVAPILMAVTKHNPDNGLQRMPTVEQKGSFNGVAVKTDFALRLMFYRGLIPDSLGADYPYLSNDNLDRVGSLLPGKNLTLRFEGQYGIFAQLWTKYLTWYSLRKQVTWTITDPSQLSFGQKYSIQGSHYLLKSRSINLGVNSISPEDCEFYLV